MNDYHERHEDAGAVLGVLIMALVAAVILVVMAAGSDVPTLIQPIAYPEATPNAWAQR